MVQDELRAVAASRGGVFTTCDLTQLGVSPSRRATRLSSGAWVSMRRGVYAECDVADACAIDVRAWHALRTAAELAASRGPAYAGRGSAACVLNLESLGRPPEAVTLIRPADIGASRGSRTPSVRLLSAALPPVDRLVFGAIATTSVARTVVDQARSLPERDAVVLADSAMRTFGLSGDDFRKVLCRQRDWPGALAACQALGRSDPRSESVLESIGRMTCTNNGLPRPMSQVWLGDERPEIRVDFYFPEFRTVGEADGRVKYATPQAIWEEKKRQDRLHDLGFDVVRFDYADAVGDGHAMAARFRRAFARGATGVGRTFEDPRWWLVSRMAGWDEEPAQLAWWLRRIGW